MQLKECLHANNDMSLKYAILTGQVKTLVEALESASIAIGSGLNWMEQVSRAKLSSATRGILTVDIGMCSTAKFKAGQALSAVKSKA